MTRQTDKKGHLTFERPFIDPVLPCFFREGIFAQLEKCRRSRFQVKVLGGTGRLMVSGL